MVAPIEGPRQNPQIFDTLKTRKDFLIPPRASKLGEESNQSNQGSSVRVVQNIAKAQEAQIEQLRFKGESQVEQFRGTLSGRPLAQALNEPNLSRLPGEVRAFDPQRDNPTPLVSLAPAEAAAIGFTPLVSQPTVSDREAQDLSQDDQSSSNSTDSRLEVSENIRTLGNEEFRAQERIDDQQQSTVRVDQLNSNRVQDFLRQEQRIQQRQEDDEQGENRLQENQSASTAFESSALTGPAPDASPSAPASETAFSSRLLSDGIQPLSMQLAQFTRLNRASSSDLQPNRPENASLEFPDLQEQQDRIQPAFSRFDEIQVQEIPKPINDNLESDEDNVLNQARLEDENRLDQSSIEQGTQQVEQQRQTQKVDNQQQGQADVGRVEVREQEDHFAGAQAVVGQVIPAEVRGETRGESPVFNLASDQGISNQIRRAVTSTPKDNALDNNDADDDYKYVARKERLDQKSEQL
jgi:hypothetical protein